MVILEVEAKVYEDHHDVRYTHQATSRAVRNYICVTFARVITSSAAGNTGNKIFGISLFVSTSPTDRAVIGPSENMPGKHDFIGS